MVPREAFPVAATSSSAASVVAGVRRALAVATRAEQLVLVLDASGSPAAVAEVAWSAISWANADQARPDESRRTRELRAWQGEVRHTGEDGLARVPSSRSPTLVFARRAGEWAWVEVGENAPQPTTLHLRVDQTLRVQVVDAALRAVADVPVSLRESGTAQGFGGDWMATTVGAPAIAEFAHVQALLPPAWDGRCAVVLDVPGRDAVFMVVDTRTLPDLVTLRLPAAGSLRVRLVTDAGPFEPLGTATSGQLFFAAEGGEGGERELRVRFPRGALDLPHVGLGLRCRLVMDGAECAGAMTFLGPRAVGEHLDIDLPVTPMPILTGRIVDQTHTARRGAWTLRQFQDSPGWLLQTFATGADGRFVLRLAQSPLPTEQSGLLFEAEEPRDDEQGFVLVERTLLHTGRNDLGDVVLGPAPILVAGRVVDPRGQGVANARLRVLRTEGSDTWGLWNVSRLDPHTAVDGSFTVRAHALPRELRLLAFTAAHAGDELLFQPPAPHVRYLLPSVGALAMPMHLGDAVAAKDLWFALRDHATGEWRGRAGRHVLEGEAFRWAGLLPGRYEFVVTTVGMASALHRVEGVEIRADEVTTLPAVDLRTVGRTVTVRVVDGAGRAIAGAGLVADPDDLGAPRTAVRSLDGTFTLPLVRAPLDLLVAAPGYRSKRVAGVRGDPVVALEPGHLIDLRVSTTPPLGADERLVPRLRRAIAAPEREPALRLDAHLVPFDPARDERLWQDDAALDRDGRVRLRVPGAGEYEIVWWLDAYRDLAPLAVRPHRFAVRNGVEPTVVEVEVALPARGR